MLKKLDKSFYVRDDVVQISKDLLGKYLCTNIDGILAAGMIVETEAYRGPEDKACHAHLNRRSKRTEIMFWEGGVAYVYLCYGMHALFNVITGFKDKPHAVLVRAIEPVERIETMLGRRKRDKLEPTITAGPGALTQALAITCAHYGENLLNETIWIEDRGEKISESQIKAGPRVGIAYAEEHTELPWRFSVMGNKWVSRAK